jgi:hypothetical protein
MTQTGRWIWKNEEDRDRILFFMKQVIQKYRNMNTWGYEERDIGCLITA